MRSICVFFPHLSFLRKYLDILMMLRVTTLPNVEAQVAAVKAKIQVDKKKKMELKFTEAIKKQEKERQKEYDRIVSEERKARLEWEKPQAASRQGGVSSNRGNPGNSVFHGQPK